MSDLRLTTTTDPLAAGFHSVHMDYKYDKRCAFTCPGDTLYSTEGFTGIPEGSQRLERGCKRACDADPACRAFVINETALSCATKSSMTSSCVAVPDANVFTYFKLSQSTCLCIMLGNVQYRTRTTTVGKEFQVSL